MKRIIIMMAVLVCTATAQKSAAQFRFILNFNIGTQPDWGPAGYNYAEYYYLPDIDVYYNVPQRRFIYFSNGRWVFAASLPYRYRSFTFITVTRWSLMNQDLTCIMKYTEQDMQGIKAGMEGSPITGTMTGINHTGDVKIIIGTTITGMTEIEMTEVVAIINNAELSAGRNCMRTRSANS